jgi:hypothetical protein
LSATKTNEVKPPGARRSSAQGSVVPFKKQVLTFKTPASKRQKPLAPSPTQKLVTAPTPPGPGMVTRTMPRGRNMLEGATLILSEAKALAAQIKVITAIASKRVQEQ